MILRGPKLLRILHGAYKRSVSKINGSLFSTNPFVQKRTIAPAKMAQAVLPCRIRVKKPEEENCAEGVDLPESAVVALRDYPDAGVELRIKWAQEVMKAFATSNPHGCIRPWDFIAMSDGSVKRFIMEPLRDPGKNAGYPARFQIPPRTLWGLDEARKVRRAEMFAMASLLYEVFSSTQIFEDLSDDEVQDRFSKGEFPDDAKSLPNSLTIYSGWSEEFSLELAKRGMAPTLCMSSVYLSYTFI